MARGDQLGLFELQVLLALDRLGDRAYGMAVWRKIERCVRHPVAIGAVYATLDRLEGKGYVTSCGAPGTPERGGRARRFFQIEQLGRDALEATLSAIDAMRK
jgi:DNA-binding PadR family transcriptional regulator